jgi:hypothetical protein
VNAYEQLQKIRDRLEERDAGPDTIRLVDRAIDLAEPERDNPLSVSQAMVLRHLFRMPAAMNNHYIQLDLEGLQGDYDEYRSRRDDDAPDATVDTEQRPQHLHSYYRKQRERGS